ncbi:hypothetical protein AMAG_01553 [Allomyces macrogynus ATCC 38327]|uniref:Methyltransferase domain-containing protein n=1 Tax=Allomyces macrogynus (strain ATCC 38327) TaxID=578462 RepID=A0A0L0RZU9_ALLM3|nr:hypothetical protein AMAG_01553 [Allomyces macrogynus ATCC 38327]|eukprot:KNE55665.1 hypothetical protein AMAG_01553 [Allomyces macrogynus ATCC 38327]
MHGSRPSKLDSTTRTNGAPHATICNGTALPAAATAAAHHRHAAVMTAGTRLDAAIPSALVDADAAPAPQQPDNPATALLRARAAGFAPATVVDDTHDENEIEAPFVPCSHDAVRAAVALLDSPADAVVMDLGCGDGRVLVEALRYSRPQPSDATTDPRELHCPQPSRPWWCAWVPSSWTRPSPPSPSDPPGTAPAPSRRAIGVELDRAVYDACAAHLRSVLTATEFAHVELRCEDMYRTDLATATHMVLYLLPACLAKLEPRLRAWLQVQEGRVLVTVGYSVPAWTPDAVTPAGPVLMAFRYSRAGLDSRALA